VLCLALDGILAVVQRLVTPRPLRRSLARGRSAVDAALPSRIEQPL